MDKEQFARSVNDVLAEYRITATAEEPQKQDGKCGLVVVLRIPLPELRDAAADHQMLALRLRAANNALMSHGLGLARQVQRRDTPTPTTTPQD